MKIKWNDVPINIVDGYEKLWRSYEWACFAWCVVTLGFLLVGAFKHDFGVIGIGLGMIIATTAAAWYIGKPK